MFFCKDSTEQAMLDALGKSNFLKVGLPLYPLYKMAIALTFENIYQRQILETQNQGCQGRRQRYARNKMKP